MNSLGNALVQSLLDPSIPTFLLGEVPPGDGTPPGQALEICRKFVNRSRSMACDGYIVSALLSHRRGVRILILGVRHPGRGGPIF